MGTLALARARAEAQFWGEPKLGIELSGSDLSPEPKPEPKPQRGSRARVPAQPRTELPNPIIEKAIVAT